MSATTNEKILNALDMYNKGLQEKIGAEYVQKDGAKVLSTNDFTDEYKSAIDGLSSFDPNTLTDTFVTKSTIDGLSSTYVQKDGAKVLSSNDFTDEYKSAIDGLSSTYVQKDGTKVLSSNDFTNDYKSAIDGLSSTYAKKSDVASVLKYRGTVTDYSAIPTDTAVGDVWNISLGGGVDENGVAIKDGDNVAKTPTGYDVLAGSIDLSGYVQKAQGKDLSSNDFTNAYKFAIDGLSSTYVEKVAGKVLSSNDFTDDYKAAIDGLSSSSGADVSAFTDTFVQKVAGKDLSTNDFTDADKTKLDSLPNISLFMKALLETNNAGEARGLLKVGREDFIDETGNRWNSTNAYLDTSAKKIGTKSLRVDGNGYLTLPNLITLGGHDFAISFWMKPTLKSAAYTLFFYGSLTANNNIIVQITAQNQFRYLDAYAGSALVNYISSSAISADWHHVELNYQQSSTTMSVFLDGAQVTSYNANSSLGTAAPNSLILGASKNNTSFGTGNIDEFFITKRLLHTATFTPPTSPYSLDSNTIALLHFDEIESFFDDTWHSWGLYGAAVSSVTKKFGAKSLQTTNGYAQTKNISLGGKDFTVSLWFYMNGTTSAHFFCWGDANNWLVAFIDGSMNCAWNCKNNGSFLFSPMTGRPAVAAGQWHHVEIDYRQSDNALFFFLNGSLTFTETTTAFATARTFPIYLGQNPSAGTILNGFIDDFLVKEEFTHDADFTPPTAPAVVDKNTLVYCSFG